MAVSVRRAGVEVFLGERLRALERRDGAVAPKKRRATELQVDVRGAGADRVGQKGIEVHGGVFGSKRRALERRDRYWDTLLILLLIGTGGMLVAPRQFATRLAARLRTA